MGASEENHSIAGQDQRVKCQSSWNVKRKCQGRKDSQWDKRKTRELIFQRKCLGVEVNVQGVQVQNVCQGQVPERNACRLGQLQRSEQWWCGPELDEFRQMPRAMASPQAIPTPAKVSYPANGGGSTSPIYWSDPQPSTQVYTYRYAL